MWYMLSQHKIPVFTVPAKKNSLRKNVRSEHMSAFLFRVIKCFFLPITAKVFGVKYRLREIRRIFSLELHNFKSWENA